MKGVEQRHENYEQGQCAEKNETLHRMHDSKTDREMQQ